MSLLALFSGSEYPAMLIPQASCPQRPVSRGDPRMILPAKDNCLRFAAVTLLALAIVFMWTFPLAAVPPTLTAVTPRGAERGKPVEVVVAGANLTAQTRLLLPFKASQ